MNTGASLFDLHLFLAMATVLSSRGGSTASKSTTSKSTADQCANGGCRESTTSKSTAAEHRANGLVEMAKSLLKGMGSSGPKRRCYTPVAPRAPKDMVGAHTERSTGITYPYNMWGPCNPSKYGHENPPDRAEKHHYGGKHDTLVKDRIEQRDFGNVKNQCYRKNLTEPTNPSSLSWLDPKHKEFWRTDVDRVLKREEEERRALQKEVLLIGANNETRRRQNAQKMTDKKYVEMKEKMVKRGCHANLSSIPHINIITREPIREQNVEMEKFRDAVYAYKVVQWQYYLHKRSNRAWNYTILNWTKNAHIPELPPWPEMPQIPPPPPNTY